MIPLAQANLLQFHHLRSISGHALTMKKGIHKLFTILVKPVFAGSLLLWSGYLLNFSFQLITGRQLGERIEDGIERNPSEILPLIVFIIISIAFIKMSWEGMLYWPKSKPSNRKLRRIFTTEGTSLGGDR